MELPASHRLPLSWLLEAASPPIQYRALAEAAPESARDPELLATLRQAVLDYKPAHAIARKQRDTGLWGGNLIGPGPSKAFGWKETGTIFQYRRLLELGWPTDMRPYRLTERFLFRLLSRDESPELLVEFQRTAKGDPGFALWVRQTFREAAAAALARAGHIEDPRLRGAAHRIASDIVMFLRGEMVEKPFRKAQGKTVLDPLAYPPTVFSMEMLAFLPVLQRERAGFVERLGHYLSTPAPRRAFWVLAGRKLLKPLFVILGDPFVGIVHPCKVYNVLALGIPFLLVSLVAPAGAVRLPPQPPATKAVSQRARRRSMLGGADTRLRTRSGRRSLARTLPPAWQIQLGITPKDPQLVERQPPLRREVRRDPRPRRHAIAERDQAREPPLEARHRVRERVAQPLDHLER